MTPQMARGHPPTALHLGGPSHWWSSGEVHPPESGDSGQGWCALWTVQKRQNPSARGAWGLLCLWTGCVACALAPPPSRLPVHGPASGSRSSSAGMNRIKFVGFADRCFHSGPHLSAFAHPGAAASIGQQSPHATIPLLPLGYVFPQCGRTGGRSPVTRSYCASAHHTAMAVAEPASLRSSNFWILPVLVLGSSPNTMARGTL